MLRGLICGIAAVALSFSAVTAQPATPRCAGQSILKESDLLDKEALARIRQQADAALHTKAMLWRIEGKGVAPSHLFGTIHVTDERVTKLPPATTKALEGASHVALEVADLSLEAIGKAMAGLTNLIVFTDGRTLADLMPSNEVEQAEAILSKNGVPREAVSRMRPWLLALSLALPACEARRNASGLKALDQEIQAFAKAQGKPLSGLETLEDQFRAMAAVPEPTQVKMLRVGLDTYGLAEDLLETMIQRYLARDIGSIWPLQMELARDRGFEASEFDGFRTELITVRNKRMRDAALPLLAKGNAFIGVGALHLPYKDGLVQLLIDEGYTLTPVE